MKSIIGPSVPKHALQPAVLGQKQSFGKKLVTAVMSNSKLHLGPNLDAQIGCFGGLTRYLHIDINLHICWWF